MKIISGGTPIGYLLTEWSGGSCAYPVGMPEPKLDRFKDLQSVFCAKLLDENLPSYLLFWEDERWKSREELATSVVRG